MHDSGQRYISDELTHFIGRNLDIEDQYAVLGRILDSGWLTHPPHEPGVGVGLGIDTSAHISQNEMYYSGIVCFCDVPLPDLRIHIDKYSPFGISFSKQLIASKGGSPVFYVASNARVEAPKPLTIEEATRVQATRDFKDAYQEVSLGEYYDMTMMDFHFAIGRIQDYIMEHRDETGVPDELIMLNTVSHFLNFHIFSFLKFFDQNLPDSHPDNFYFEREWRILGHLQFKLEDVRRILLPSQFARKFREDHPDYYGQLTIIDV